MGSLEEPRAGATPPFLPARAPLSVMDAIYARRTVRDFTADDIPAMSLHALLYAAVQAPSVVAGDVWGFAVVQDRAILKALSDSAMCFRDDPENRAKRLADTGGDSNIFFNAGTLVVIYGRDLQSFAQADCWLAAENLMLAACGMGVGSCVIGSAVEALNLAEWKARLEIPEEMTAFAPIILGIPAKGTSPVHRPAPNVMSWTHG